MESVELPFQRPLRRLQQENGVAIVEQPADFVTALAFGEEHIELRAHLDYTLFAHVEQERVWAPVLFPETVKTLKGNCSEPIPTQAQLGLTGPAMVEGKPGMCLLVFVGDCFSMVAPGGSQVLLDNLYLRQNVFPERFSTETAIVKVERSEFDAPLEQSPALWMTNVTVQGSGEGNVRGMQLSSRLYAEDCVFSALGDGVPVIDVRRRAQLSTAGSDSTSASFVNCWFQDNTVQDDDGIIKAREFTGVQLRKSFFVGNDASHLLYSEVDSTTGPGTFYSDALRNVWHSGKGINVPTGSLWEASVSGYSFLSTNDTFYVDANQQQVQMMESSSSKGLSAEVIAGIAVAIVVTILAAAAIAIAVFRCRRARKRHEAASSDTHPMHEVISEEKPGSNLHRQLPPRSQPMVYGNHQLSMSIKNTTPAPSLEPAYAMHGIGASMRRSHPHLPSHTQSGEEELPMPSGQMANAITKSVDTNSHSQVSQVVAFDEISREQKMLCTTIKAQPPPSDAKLDDRKAFLKSQLDGLMWATVLGSLTLITGRNSRMSGGQAVVQIAEDRGTRIEYAMKFFLSRAAFEHELALYADNSKPLGAFLPEVHSIIDPSKTKFLDAAGVPLPPCIIMEKGESLDKWAASCTDGLDMVTGLQVLTHVAERLSDLHAAGYVHRDIKPANIMWLPRKKRWTLIDFGCAARTGTSASNSFTPVFASPEVIRTHQEGGKKIEVTEAMDSWSVGILALELFTGKPAFSQFQTREKTMAMITGFDPAPWEAESTRALVLHRLGSLKRPILQLLDRNPSSRLTMDGFHEACCRVLALTSDSNYSAALY